MSWGKVGLFVGGVLFGTAGIKLLSSKDAKKVYSQCTAAALRIKDTVVDQATVLQENCTDIYEEAKQINRERAEKEEDIVIDEVDVEEAEAEAEKSAKKRSQKRKTKKAVIDIEPAEA